MKNGKKYYLNIASYKYKREYMKLYQSNIDKIINTYSNRNPEIMIESQNLCPGGKRCKNYLIIMNLEQTIKTLNDKINQLSKIKEYSEINHNIDFTPMKTVQNNNKDTFKEICNSFRNSRIKRKLNISTRNTFGNNTLQPQISEPYRLKLDNKNNNEQNKIAIKKLNGKKQINLDLNKFKNIGVRLNAEKTRVNEENTLNKNTERTDLKHINNGNYDEKEKKIQNLINHIFNNKNNELIINKKLEESKNKEDIKALKKIKFSKIKVNSYNLLIPNQKNKKIKNKRYNLDLSDEINKVETNDENELYFRKFKGKLKNSFDESRKKLLSKSLGFNTGSKEDKYNILNINDKFSKTVSENKKISFLNQAINISNGFRPSSLTQKPFKLKININKNNNESKQEKEDKKENNNFKLINEENNIDKFFKIFENKKEEKSKTYNIYKELIDLSNYKYESLVEKLKSLTNDKMEEYIQFIKDSFIFMKDLIEIYNKLKSFYNMININKNFDDKNTGKNSNSEYIKYSLNIKQILQCDFVFIYIYESKSDYLILKGEKEEFKYPKNKNLIGQCFASGNILNTIVNEDIMEESSPVSLNKNDRVLFCPIKDLDNITYGVIEVIKKISDIENNNNTFFNKKDEIIISFISKTLGIYYKYFNYNL